MNLKTSIYQLALICLLSAFYSCSSQNVETPQLTKTNSNGKLFIIGGGKRPSEMIKKMMEVSGLQKNDAIYILPWASSEPDSSSYYAKQQFEKLGHFSFIDLQPEALDSLGSSAFQGILSAPLIYIPGGDQRRFMDIAIKNGYDSILHQAYENGSTIAGTSAGAAIMSENMITGTALKYEEYYPTFRTLEADNLELDTGLGLLPENIIIDQHFIYRSRYNRLLTAIIENPNLTGWGIEESTAALVQGDSVTVVGKYQLIRFKNRSAKSMVQNGLLGEKEVDLSIFLPNTTFSIH